MSQDPEARRLLAKSSTALCNIADALETILNNMRGPYSHRRKTACSQFKAGAVPSAKPHGTSTYIHDARH